MLTLTESAQKAVSRFIQSSEAPANGLRISVTGGGCSGLQYALGLETEASDTDSVIQCGDVQVFIDPESAPMLQGVTVDFLDTIDGSGFKFMNPNATASCNCGSSFAT